MPGKSQGTKKREWRADTGAQILLDLWLLLLCFFQFFFELIEFFEALHKYKDAENHQDKAYTFSDFVGNALV